MEIVAIHELHSLRTPGFELFSVWNQDLGSDKPSPSTQQMVSSETIVVCGNWVFQRVSTNRGTPV